MLQIHIEPLPALVKEIREAIEAVGEAKDKLDDVIGSPQVNKAIKELNDIYEKLKEILNLL